jgi:hypothetical protein
VHGDGVAATCCAHLLARARLADGQAPRPRLPALLLTPSALELIRDVFGAGDLFRNSHRIRRRIVTWGPHARSLTLDHSATVVSEDELLQSLLEKRDFASSPCPDRAAWNVFASRPLPPDAFEHTFGSRLAFAATVTLKSTTDTEACWIESLDEGWIFLISRAHSHGALLCVGGEPDRLLGRSTLIAPQIQELSSPVSQFPAYPRIVSPLCGPGWLACGSAAMAFDPICGDGTAHAIRQAILASAVIRAAASNEKDQLLSHYQARLTAGFRRHLLLCRQFYASGGDGAWWRAELEALESGIAWCEEKLSGARFEYQLDGFDLQRV